MPFPKHVYLARRLEFAKLMKSGVALIPTSRECIRSRDTNFPFRPDSYFYYLSGFSEPEAVIMIIAGENPKSILFCWDKNAEMEAWTGFRYGSAEAKDVFGFNEAYSISQLDEKIWEILNGQKYLYLHKWDNRATKWIEATREMRMPPEIREACPILDEMRLIKSVWEIELMRKAAEISAAGHLRAMLTVRPLMQEYRLEAEVSYMFRFYGASPLHAYPTIVAGGKNACTLHYVQNDQILSNGDLVLIDAGCELDGYASDITRTIPVNGKFNSEQKNIYNLVLKAQYAAIEASKPGNTIDDPDKAARKIIAEGLADLGIVKREEGKDLIEAASKKYFFHSTSHWLGMDVHDVGRRVVDNEPRKLAPGMVFTVEPGIYIAPGSDAPEKWWGIGVRIEDDLVITETGYEILSVSVPKEIADIEDVMRRGKK